MNCGGATACWSATMSQLLTYTPLELMSFCASTLSHECFGREKMRCNAEAWEDSAVSPAWEFTVELPARSDVMGACGRGRLSDGRRAVWYLSRTAFQYCDFGRSSGNRSWRRIT